MKSNLKCSDFVRGLLGEPAVIFVESQLEKGAVITRGSDKIEELCVFFMNNHVGVVWRFEESTFRTLEVTDGLLISRNISYEDTYKLVKVDNTLLP